MSRPLTRRLAALAVSRASPRATGLGCPVQAAFRARPFSQTSAQREDPKTSDEPNADADATAKVEPRRTVSRPNTESLLEGLYGTSQAARAGPEQSNAMSNLSQNLVFKSLNSSHIDTSALSGGQPREPRREDELEPFHFHVYSHKHNTHVTFTRPNREPIISLSCGNIGYKKSRRALYDSAYSLIKYVIERLKQNGWPAKVQRLEVVLRGFGQGREAALKVLMGPDGTVLRDKIVRVADSTRIKFGGTRSKAQRRL